MVLQNSALREYLQPVLTCLGTESLLTAINRCYRAESEWVVIVDSQQRPLGCIALSRLSHYLLKAMPVSVGAEPASPRSEVAHIPLQRLLPDLATGLVTIPAELNLIDALPFLQHPIPSTILGLISATGEFLGLLDEQHLLQTLANHLSQPEHKFSILPGRETTSKRSTLPPQLRQVTQLTQQLLAQRSEFELRLRSQQQIIEYLLKQATSSLFSSNRGETGNATSPFMLATETQGTVPLLPMQALLEYLPLPLMLQTSDGQVLIHNAIWREQFEDLLDPIDLRREAASVLEQSSDSAPRHASSCESGSQPGSCICICPLKDGGDRMIQFVKVLLGHLIPSEWPIGGPVARQPDMGTSQPGSAELFPIDFRLAALKAEHARGISDTANAPRQQVWLVLAQDITEQHRLARDLTAKNADLMQLNRLKDEFLACISHELRTPLTAVLGLSTLLSDQTLGPLNPRQARYAQLIHQSGRHLMAVVNDIMDLTRIETGQLALTWDRVNLKTVCEQAFEQARQKQRLEAKASDETARQEPSFTLEIESGLTAIVADELRLRQMLENLLSNAFKFTEAPHSIGLQVNRWGGWIAFTVWDTGIGIPNDQQHLIFQKFQQLESPLTRRFEGTGLGLVLTQRLARLHGGEISFLSQEGKGSRFTILLPPQPPAEVSLPACDRTIQPSQLELKHLGVPATQADRNRLVLIVEAVPHFIDRLSTQLINLGYRVIVARAGTEALEKARRLQPSVIFLNPLLPMLSGWDVLTLLKTRADTQSIPVVVTATPVDQEQAHRYDADGFLQIPIQIEPLRQVVGQLLTRQTQVTAPVEQPPRLLTLLRLCLTDFHLSPAAIDFNELLQGYHYRLLEADNVEQAELLARIWNPELIILDGSPSNWLTFLQQLRHHTMLATRPLITLDGLAQAAAHQVPGLTVFTRPLMPETDQVLAPQDIQTAWLRLIQLAIGYIWQPMILAVDNALWSDQDLSNLQPGARQSCQSARLCETEWAHALMQYLITAGLRGHISQSRQEAMDLLHSGTVDLLLISWTEDRSETAIGEIVQAMHQLSPRPPLLVLDHRTYEPSRPSPRPLPDGICTIADRVISSSLPMTDLLDTIQALLG